MLFYSYMCYFFIKNDERKTTLLDCLEGLELPTYLTTQ